MITQPAADPAGRTGPNRLKSRRKGLSTRAKTAWLIAAIVGVFALGMALSGGGREFLRTFYSPAALVIVVFMMVEYILLKGRDRSRFLRIELDQMREKRHQAERLLRDAEKALAELEAGLIDSAGFDNALEKIRSLREKLSRRI